VKDVERKKGEELFGSAAEPSQLALKVSYPPCSSSFFLPRLPGTGNSDKNVKQIMGIKSRTFEAPSANGIAAAAPNKNYRVKLTDKERKKVEEMIRKAKTLEEIIRLEKELNEGKVPAGAHDDAMEE